MSLYFVRGQSVAETYPHGGGCTWVKKRIKRTAIRLLLGSEHRGFRLINSVKNEPQNFYLFSSIFV